MLLVGSQAMKHHFPEFREPKDTDYICTFDEFNAWVRARKANENDIIRCVPLSGDKFHVRTKDSWNYEFEIAWPESSGWIILEFHDAVNKYKVCSAVWLYALKMSHRYLKNNPHFLKTMQDIHFLRGKLLPEIQEAVINNNWFRQREAETYTYNHPKLDVSKKEFFTDDVPYVYDHDDLHRIIAIDGIPAYTNYMRDGSEVMTDMEKFFAVDHRVRLLGGLEEAMVLSCERSLIPNNFVPDPDTMFFYALQKVCTSITSGKFREFCWEYWDEIVNLYHEVGGKEYAEKIKSAINSGRIKRLDGK